MILKEIYDLTIDYKKRKKEIEENFPLLESKIKIINLKLEVNLKIDNILFKFYKKVQ